MSNRGRKEVVPTHPPPMAALTECLDWHAKFVLDQQLNFVRPQFPLKRERREELKKFDRMRRFRSPRAGGRGEFWSCYGLPMFEWEWLSSKNQDAEARARSMAGGWGDDRDASLICLSSLVSFLLHPLPTDRDFPPVAKRQYQRCQKFGG